ncbi:MAG: 2Fe-2S iron-sulfur cluster binding domain-containing protein [Pseudomonadota bacterium]
MADADGPPQTFQIELHPGGETFTVPPDRTIIEVLEAAGYALDYDCQRGDCGVCETRVIAGTPDHRDVMLTKAEKASGKTMLICVSRALTPRLVIEV